MKQALPVPAWAESSRPNRIRLTPYLFCPVNQG